MSRWASSSSASRVGGEVLVAQHLVRAEAQREHVVAVGLVLLVVRVGIGSSPSSSSSTIVTVSTEPSAGLAGTGSPERGEDPVVGGDVLGPVHERGPAGPVERRARLAVERRRAPRRT